MRYVLGLAAFAAVLGTLPARADDCATLMSTMIAQTTIPYSATVTMTGPNVPPQVTKSIFTGTKFYSQADGQWRVMTIDPQQEQAMIREAAKASQETCHRQGNSSINGQATTLYVSHVISPGSTSDNKVWVAGNRILKTEVQIQGGPHIVSVYDYGHVTPPANAAPMTPPPPQ